MTAKVRDKNRDHYRSLDAAGVIAKSFDAIDCNGLRRLFNNF